MKRNQFRKKREKTTEEIIKIKKKEIRIRKIVIEGQKKIRLKKNINCGIITCYKQILGTLV